MSTQSFAMFVRFVNTCSRLFVREVAILSCKSFRDLKDHQLVFPHAGFGSDCATYFLSGHAQLDIIHSYVHMMPDNLAHLIRTISGRCDSSNERPIPPSKLLPISQVTRSWNVPCVDRIPDYHVQAFLCGSCTEAPSTHDIH